MRRPPRWPHDNRHRVAVSNILGAQREMTRTPVPPTELAHGQTVVGDPDNLHTHEHTIVVRFANQEWRIEANHTNLVRTPHQLGRDADGIARSRRQGDLR
jgi:hypothetical protein